MSINRVHVWSKAVQPHSGQAPPGDITFRRRQSDVLIAICKLMSRQLLTPSSMSSVDKDGPSVSCTCASGSALETGWHLTKD